MNILYLTQFLSASRGGAPLIFYDLAKSLSERGHKVFIICNIATEKIDNENVKLIIVKPFGINTSEMPPSPIDNLRYIINSVLSGIKIARLNNIDIIHTSFFTSAIAGSILSKIIRVPMVASIFDIFTNSDKSNWENWARFNDLPSYFATIGRLYEKISLSVPYDLIHTISNSTRNDILHHITNKRIEVVYPSIRYEFYQDKEPVYDNFILYIGRLVFYKNVDVLIKAYKDVVQHLPSAKLFIVGEGPMKEKWENMSKLMGVDKNIIFTNHVSEGDKLHLLRNCSALALPSVFEGFGLVILESFAMAKPALVTKIPPLDEIVDDGVDGFTLSYDDPSAWARKIIDLLTDKQLCKRMGAMASEKLGNKFGFSKYINNMEHLYYQLKDRA